MWIPRHQQLTVGAEGQPDLSICDRNLSSLAASTGPGSGGVGEDPAASPSPMVFFAVAERSMPSLTLLGQTSMQNVDLFIQTYSCVSEWFDQERLANATLLPQSSLKVASWCIAFPCLVAATCIIFNRKYCFLRYDGDNTTLHLQSWLIPWCGALCSLLVL